MEGLDVLKSFEEIKIESPVDKIIRQIRSLITSGQLNAGDKLPSERKLSERLGIGRSYVRVALQKLEFYGILKTLPQSGTVVAGIGITALEGLISDVLKIDNSDFASLVETRIVLEIEAARLAALRRTEEDLEQIKAALDAYEKIVKRDNTAIEQDLMFHLTIAEASKNSVLKSLMLIITPDIIRNFNQLNICDDGRSYTSLEEHRIILEHIIDGNADGAAAAMEEHLQEVLRYSYDLKRMNDL